MNSMLIYKSCLRVTVLPFLLYLYVLLPVIKQGCKAIGKTSSQPEDTIEMLLIVRIKQELHS